MKKAIPILALALLAAACGSRTSNATARTTRNTIELRHAVAVDPQRGIELPPGHPPISGEASPDDSDESDSLVVSGKVAQTMNAGGYTYLRVATADGDVWAAVPQTQLKVGEAVTVNGQLLMENFKSKRLERSFEKIIFGTIEGDDSPLPAETSTNVVIA